MALSVGMKVNDIRNSSGAYLCRAYNRKSIYLGGTYRPRMLTLRALISKPYILRYKIPYHNLYISSS